MLRALFVAVVMLAVAVPMRFSQAEIITAGDAMVAGTDGYPVYRIPGFTVAADGSLLLFAEGRPSQSDPGGAGDIDVVFKRSTDGGLTWSPLEVLRTKNGFDYSDPRVVLDRITGTAHLQYVQWPTDNGQTSVPTGLGSDSALIFHQSSADHGQTWSSAVDISSQVKDPSWASINTGPGLGIQLKYQDAVPERNGRILIPGHHRPPAYRGVALYSDDGGDTWTHGSGSTPHFSDESEVIELTNGDLLWDARRGSSGRNRSISHDGGDTWVEAHEGDIPISAVDSGLVRYSAAREGHDRDRILYSSPLGSPAGAGNGRSNIGIWTSYDEGKTFINPIQIESGSAAYSVVDKLSNGTIGLIYEVNHNTIRYINFDLAELEKAEHPAALTHYDGFGNKVDSFRGGVGWSGAWNNSGVSVVPGVLEFAGFLTKDDGQHAHLRGDEMTRDLGSGSIDLNQNGSHYFSLFVKHDGSDGDNSGSEYLDVLMQDGSGATQAAFGIGSGENFFVNDIGNTVSSDTGSLALDTTYLVLAKLVAKDDSQGANSDQLFLAWYDDPLSVPTEEDDVEWQLVGDTTENVEATIEQITIRAGSNADWRLDGLRIGTAFDAVVHDTGIGPPLVLGDLDGDRVLSLSDWVAFKANFRTHTSAMDSDTQLRMGDFDQSGLVGTEDFLAFRGLFDAEHSKGALAAATASVPEPNSLVLLGGASFLLWRASPAIPQFNRDATPAQQGDSPQP